MRSKLFILTFCIKSLIVFSQDSLQNNFAIAPTHNNFFYKGIDNPFDIAVSNIPFRNIFLKSDNGTIIKNNEKFSINAVNGNSVTIFIYKTLNKDTTYIGSEQFRLKKIPTPIAYIGDKTKSDSISKNELLSIQGMTARFEDFDFDLRVSVKYYEVRIFHEEKEVNIKCNGPKFTDELKNEFLKCNKGATIIFRNIKVDYADKLMQELKEPIILTLKY